MTSTTTGTVLDDLFDFGDLELALQGGCVREQNHPTLPLKILNYTEKAAYEGVWNPVTLQCRGLIVNVATHEIVARPFAKFFNYGQAGAAEIPLDAEVVVADKMDGSLGIVYPTGDGRYAVATRGSFTSDQALHATEVLHSRYPTWWPTPGWTCLFEIVYPQNRIVCDYGAVDDLVALGAVEIATGRIVGPSELRLMSWKGPVAEIFDAGTLAEALTLEPRPNAEGVVVREVATGSMLKIKQEDYVKLHRIVTGLTARTVWEHMLSGAPLADLIAPLPDEFHAWVAGIATGILEQVASEYGRLTAAFDEIVDRVLAANPSWEPGDRAARKEFALAVGVCDDSWAMYPLLDGRDIQPELLKRARPEPYVTPAGRIFTEETA